MEGVEYTAEVTLKNVPQDYKSSGAVFSKVVGNTSKGISIADDAGFLDPLKTQKSELNK